MAGFSLANYIAFFTDQYQYKTVGITFRLAVPNTIVVVAISLLFAYNMRRGIAMERTITTILVIMIAVMIVRDIFVRRWAPTTPPAPATPAGNFDDAIARIVESAQRLGVELDEKEARAWVDAMATRGC